MVLFHPYEYDAAFSYENGWDKYALKYATLLVPDTLYYLHKQVMYDYIDANILPKFNRRAIKVLDVNCGTGNDFPYWLNNSSLLVGTDGSKGMLNKAHETYRQAIEDGKLKLYRGMLEDLQENSLGEDKFDIIYSITGGFSYIDDKVFERTFRVLKNMLAPGGVMVTAHLNSFCLSETVSFLLKRQFKRSVIRLKKRIEGKNDIMYLRNKGLIEKLLQPHFTRLEFFPLICIAPPYQTDHRFSKRSLQLFRAIENKMVKMNIGKTWADQVVVVCR